MLRGCSLFQQHKSSPLKWIVSPSFRIHLHVKDLALLQAIRDTFNVGKIYIHKDKTATFRVNKIQELQVIIEHFNKYPLVSVKVSDFLLFQQCYNLIKQNLHLTSAGLEEIISLKYNLNKGLSLGG